MGYKLFITFYLGFLKIGDPQITMNAVQYFYTPILDDLGYSHFKNPLI